MASLIGLQCCKQYKEGTNFKETNFPKLSTSDKVLQCFFFFFSDLEDHLTLNLDN